MRLSAKQFALLMAASLLVSLGGCSHEGQVRDACKRIAEVASGESDASILRSDHEARIAQGLGNTSPSYMTAYEFCLEVEKLEQM
jgi:hypothetical protein